MTAELIERAKSGDGDAFRDLVAPHEAELRLHCYRMLGSAQDAEDALQEILLAAWQGLAAFEGRAALRTWLYRVATTRCLNALRARSRRAAAAVPAGITPPPPTRLGEVTWLEPYPDALLAGLPDTAPGPEARYEAREAISLAFITAMQLLPPRQRAALLLRDVLGFPASEAASLLGVTEESVTSALKRARAALGARQPSAGQPSPGQPSPGQPSPGQPSPGQASAGQPSAGGQFPAPAAGSGAERRLAQRLTDAYERGDVAGIVALFTEDAWLRMPPMPLEYRGRDLIGEFLRAVAFRDGRTYRLVPVRMNGQLAFESFLPGATASNDLLVLDVSTADPDALIAAMTRFPPLRPLGERDGV